MNLEARKLQLVQQILLVTDESVLGELEKTMRSVHLGSETQLEASIANGLLDIEEGRTYAHEDVQAYVRKKYGL